VRDAFAADYTTLAGLWEAISPDPILSQHEDNYRWLRGVCFRPASTATGALLWMPWEPRPRTDHQNVHVEAVRDDIAEIVLDADLLESMLQDPRS